MSYEESASTKVMSRIPVIIKIDGRLFSRATRNVQKPFCHKTMAMLSGTMLSLVKQIDGVVFGYQYSDKIILVLRNDRSEDEDPWFGNDTQAMCSAAASLATYELLSQLWDIDQPPDLEGNLTFKASVFGLPSITEAINYIVYQQYCCMQDAINGAVKAVTGSIIDGMTIDDRKKLLDDAGVSLDAFPAAFRHGAAAYVAPKLVHTTQGEVTHRKWLLDFEVPLFVEKKDRDRLRTILTTGSDIFRPERDL